MFGFLVGLVSIIIPLIGIYNFHKNFPIQEFVQLSDSTQNLLFHPTWDVMFIFFIVAALFLYTIATGRGRITLIIIGTYVAYAVSNFLFLQNSFFGYEIPPGSIPKLVVFASVFLFILYFLFRSQIGSLIRSGLRDVSWWNALLQSVMEAGLLSTLLYTFLSPAETELLSPLTMLVIANPSIQLGWVVAPFLWFVILDLVKRE